MERTMTTEVSTLPLTRKRCSQSPRTLRMGLRKRLNALPRKRNKAKLVLGPRLACRRQVYAPPNCDQWVEMRGMCPQKHQPESAGDVFLVKIAVVQEKSRGELDGEFLCRISSSGSRVGEGCDTRAVQIERGTFEAAVRQN
jgi:hypothetical protein